MSEEKYFLIIKDSHRSFYWALRASLDHIWRFFIIYLIEHFVIIKRFFLTKYSNVFLNILILNNF